MSTQAQIEANRINCLSSTGPRTAEGKTISSRNATSHGLSSLGDPVLPHEDRAEFEMVGESYAMDFAPRTNHEHYLVHEMTAARWRIARADRLMNIILVARASACEVPQQNEADPEIRIAQIMVGRSGDPIARLERHRAALERTYHRCVRELRAAQKFRNEAQPSVSAEPSVFEEENSVFSVPSLVKDIKENPASTYIRSTPKIGRNDYCPCRSGLKYKKCCLNKPAQYAA